MSFHGLALLPADLSLADAAAMGGFCSRGLWVKVCLSGPAGRNEMGLLLDKPRWHQVIKATNQTAPLSVSSRALLSL